MYISRDERIGRLRFARPKYVEGFRDKWIPDHRINSEELLGTGDIQPLADLGNSYTVVQEKRLVPLVKDVTRLAAATAAPMVPLLLLVWSPEKVIMQVLKVVF